MVWRLVPDAVVEIIARCAGYAAGLFCDRAHAAERLVRGKCLGLRLAARRLHVCRGVHLECERSIRLGDSVTLHAGCHLVAGRGGIVIGDGTHLGVGCMVAGLGNVVIGRGCAISSGVAIYSVTNHFRAAPSGPILDNDVVYDPVHIGDDVWIGANVTILPGVTIGDHAVVGAGAVVNRDVPAWQIVAGVPARHLKDRREPAPASLSTRAA